MCLADRSPRRDRKQRTGGRPRAAGEGGQSGSAGPEGHAGRHGGPGPPRSAGTSGETLLLLPQIHFSHELFVPDVSDSSALTIVFVVSSQGKSPTDTHIKQVCMRVMQGKCVCHVHMLQCFSLHLPPEAEKLNWKQVLDKTKKIVACSSFFSS